MGSDESKNDSSSSDKSPKAKCESKEIRDGSCAFEWRSLVFNGASTEYGKCLYSPEFKSSDGPTWRLQLYPHGHTVQLKDYMSIFLQLLSSDCDNVDTKCTVTLLNSKRELAVRHKSVAIKNGRPEGWFTFLKRSHILDGLDGKTSCKLMVKCELSFTYTAKTHDSEDSASSDGELSKDLLALYDSGSYTDVTLRVDGKEIKAHKLILAARSPVFDCIFKQPPEIYGCVDIPKVSLGNCQRLVSFIYTGNTDDFPTVYSAMELYAAAQKFAVYALMERCVRFIASSYDAKNAVGILVFADKYGERDLKRLVVEFISQSFKDIGQTTMWEKTVNENPLLGTEVLHHVATTYKKT